MKVAGVVALTSPRPDAAAADAFDLAVGGDIGGIALHLDGDFDVRLGPLRRPLAYWGGGSSALPLRVTCCPRFFVARLFFSALVPHNTMI
jgi:hypothetical protein